MELFAAKTKIIDGINACWDCGKDILPNDWRYIRCEVALCEVCGEQWDHNEELRASIEENKCQTRHI